MRQMMQTTSFSRAMLLALTLLLAACGGSTSSPAPTPTATSASAADVKGDFAGVTNSVNFISLSTEGPLLVAYVCDGTQNHHISLAQWFKGVVTKNAVNLTAKGGAHLVATLSAQGASGTVTLASGKSFRFTTHALASQKEAGLFRSEKTVGRVRYLAGWVLPPSRAQLPAQASQGGGIINEETGAVLPAPVLTSQDIAAGQVMVPGLGMFPLTRCSLGKCG